MSSSATSEFGWVVPVPSVPELASVEPALAEHLFVELSWISQPSVTRRSDRLKELLGIICVFVAPAAGVVLLLLCLASFFTPSLLFVRRRRKLLTAVSLLLILISAISIAAIWVWRDSYMLPMSRSGGYAVDVIREEQVGIYDVQVVEADEAGDLIQWLNEHHFQFDEEDTRVFDEYLRRGWCFVVARVDPTRSADDKFIAEGLVAPLILVFRQLPPCTPWR